MRRRVGAGVLLTGIAISACSSSGGTTATSSPSAPSTPTPTATPTPVRTHAAASGLPGMPPVLDPHDIYAADRPNPLSPVVQHDPALIYVPNSDSDPGDVIDQKTFHIIGHYDVGNLPQRVVPSYPVK